jgi:hypothetical protein
VATAAGYALCPAVLAHASMALLEIPLAFFCVGTIVSFVRWNETSETKFWLAWSALWTMALLTKLTALILVPAFLLCPWLSAEECNRPRLFMKTAAGLLAGLVLAESIMRLLGTSYWHAQASGRGLAFFLQKMPVYFHNQILPSARWYHALAAWWMKMPVPLPLLACGGFIVWLRHRPRDPLLAVLTVIILESLLLMLCVRSIIATAHYFLLIPVSCLLLGSLLPEANNDYRRGVLAVSAAIMAAGLWMVRPGYMAYFNVLVGGTSHGSQWLWDSDQDWGQDLPRVAEWMRAEKVAQIILAYSGSADPRAYGIHYQDLLSPALITRVYRGDVFKTWPGRQYVVIGTKVLQSEPRWLAWWRLSRVPSARIGGTFFIYDITHDNDSKRWLTTFYRMTHRPAFTQSLILTPPENT